MKKAAPPSLPDESSQTPTIRRAQLVYERLRDDIFGFRLLPGDRFAENDIAERLQVSRTPVREGLMRLQSEGLVRCYFRNGWEVVPIDLSRFSALYELREMIELHALRRVCTLHETAPAHAAILAKLDAIWRVPSDRHLNDGLALAALDEQFHLELVSAAGNPETTKVFHHVTENIRIMRRLDFVYGDCIADTYTEHVAILDAIKFGDVALANALMTKHIGDGHMVVQQITLERLEHARAKIPQDVGTAPARRKRFG